MSGGPLNGRRAGGPGGGSGAVCGADRLRGHATFRPHGAKPRGEYALTRFRSGDDGEEAWLPVRAAKSGSGGRGAPGPRQARSARTGRTLARVAEEDG